LDWFSADSYILPMELSNEDMAGTTLSVLKSIGTIVKNTADTMLSEMSALEVAARYIGFKANNLTVMSKDRRYGDSKQSSFTVNTRIANLSVKYYPCTDYGMLNTAFGILFNSVKPYLSYHRTAHEAVDRLNVSPGRV